MLDADGEIAHARRRHRGARALSRSGCACSAGGTSNFIDGVGRDAEALAAAMARFLGAQAGGMSMAGIAPRYDVVIVGARPAGAATALLLSRAGARVLRGRAATRRAPTRSRPTR